MGPESPGTDNKRALLVRFPGGVLDAYGRRLVERRLRHIVGFRLALVVITVGRIGEIRTRTDGAFAHHRGLQSSKGLPWLAWKRPGKCWYTNDLAGGDPGAAETVQQIATVGLVVSSKPRRSSATGPTGRGATTDVSRGALIGIQTMVSKRWDRAR